MSHISSFIDAPFRNDRGRRILNEPSGNTYQKYDFLKDLLLVGQNFL